MCVCFCSWLGVSEFGVGLCCVSVCVCLRVVCRCVLVVACVLHLCLCLFVGVNVCGCGRLCVMCLCMYIILMHAVAILAQNLLRCPLIFLSLCFSMPGDNLARNQAQRAQAARIRQENWIVLHSAPTFKWYALANNKNEVVPLQIQAKTYLFGHELHSHILQIDYNTN